MAISTIWRITRWIGNKIPATPSFLKRFWDWYENPAYGKVVSASRSLNRPLQTAHKLGKTSREVLCEVLSKRAVSFKPKWEYIIIAFLLGIILTGHRANVIPETSPYKPTVKDAETVQIAVPAEQAQEQPIVETPIYSPPVYSGGINCGSDPYMAQIYQRESGCCPTKWQGQHVCPGTYTALHDPADGWIGYGLCQSTPAIKMATAGADWATSWATQNAWCVNYANARYGSPAAAWAHWLAFHNW